MNTSYGLTNILYQVDTVTDKVLIFIIVYSPTNTYLDGFGYLYIINYQKPYYTEFISINIFK